MRPLSSLLYAAPLLLVSAGAAFAHAHLLSVSPPADSTITATPDDVTIVFSEGVEPRFSAIAVTDAAGQRVDDGQPHLAGAPTRLAVGLRPLAVGSYSVAWNATSVDTHKTDGRYEFTLAAADASGVTVDHVWARPSAGAATNGAAYLTVTDKGAPDRLTGVASPVAAMVGLHETIDDNGVMKMRPVAGIALEPGKPVTFKPGGYNIMLMGLKTPLKAGDSFPLTLTFEHAAPMTVTAKVEAAAPSGGMDPGHGGMGSMGGMAH